ncbi:hypothetical protein [Venatoribacter cucullus]|uniref:hypothetical protein n=1 Tax=Venatoribacter cucullus TaxID=2661630 RepID=UPI002240B2E4|nr:hypothetical protein [Venatoribacter cucullus]UZK03423.1 hypothetical protein GAY96_05710 [Venatoribacter cucullus]
MLRIVFITALILLPSIGSAEPTNFRAGIGAFALDIGHAPAGLPDGSQTGFSLFGEFPQSNHTASRFILYRIDGGDGVRLTGGETQLMWGMGLAQPGFRLYTGPAWHYDRMRVTRSGGHNTRTFNGWGWQIGTGWQYRAVTLDVAATFRDRHDYNRETRRAGLPKGDVWTHNLLLSYRF